MEKNVKIMSAQPIILLNEKQNVPMVVVVELVIANSYIP
jgi:hypothetical protein